MMMISIKFFDEFFLSALLNSKEVLSMTQNIFIFLQTTPNVGNIKNRWLTLTFFLYSQRENWTPYLDAL